MKESNKSLQILHKQGKICVERMAYMTEYLIAKQTSNEHHSLKRAQAIGYYLGHKKPVVYDKGRLLGTMTAKEKGMQLYAELNDLVIWRDLSNEHLAGKLTKEESILLNKKIFPYWMTHDMVAHFENRCKDSKLMKFFKQQEFCKISEQSGLVPDFTMFLEQGLLGVLERIKTKKEDATDEKTRNFYTGVEVIGEGAIDYARRLVQEARALSETVTGEMQTHYMKLAELGEKVPLEPAQSFLEAVQSIWFYIMIMGTEYSLEGMNLGRLDQVLYPYYKKDVAQGRLDEDDALEILSEFWNKLGDYRRIKEEKHKQYVEGVLAITIGGVNEKGEDAINALTYLFLRVSEGFERKRPILILRMHEELNPKEYIHLICRHRGNIIDGYFIANDKKNIALLQERGFSLQESYNYVVMTNGVLGVPGLSYEGSAKVTINLVAMVELALYNGRYYETGRKQWGPLTGEPENFESFEEFLSACKVQLKYLINQSIKVFQIVEAAGKEHLSIPFTSLFLKGVLDKGQDLTKGTSKYVDEAVRFVGLKEAIDTWIGVKDTVFEDEYCSFKKLMQAVRDNFKDHKQLETYLKAKCTYGESRGLALTFSKIIKQYIEEILEEYTTLRAGHYYGTYGMNVEAIKMGKQTAALPSGRKAYEAFLNEAPRLEESLEELEA